MTQQGEYCTGVCNTKESVYLSQCYYSVYKMNFWGGGAEEEVVFQGSNFTRKFHRHQCFHTETVSTWFYNGIIQR